MDRAKELITVQLIPKDFGRAADLLVKSFYYNPSHVCIFADKNTRARLLKWGLKANLKLNLPPLLNSYLICLYFSN